MWIRIFAPRPVLSAFAATWIILAANAALSRWSSGTLAESERWVSHTHEVLSTVESLMSNALDAESGQRGYLLTGREEHLDRYQAAVGDLGDTMRRFRKLTADNPRQKPLIDAAADLVGQKLELIRRTVELRRAGRADGALAVVAGGEGKRIMDGLRRTADAMEREERRLLAERTERSAQAARMAGWTFLLSTAANLSLPVAVFWLVNRDLAKREHVVSSLRESGLRSELTLNSVLDSIGEGVAAADADGTLTLFNPAAERLLGNPREPIGPEAWSRRYGLFREDGTPWPAEELPLAKALRGQSVDGAELFVRNANVSPGLWLSVSARPVRGPDGAIRGGVAVFSDVTARRQAARARQERGDQLSAANRELVREVADRRAAEDKLAATAAELTRSNSDLEQFAYVASHDLQEPLRNIAGPLQMLVEQYRGRLDAEADQLIGFAVDGAARMRRLITDLLAYSRVGSKGFNPRPTDLGAVLADALANLRTAVEESGAVITNDPLPTVTADAGQMTQVLQNLVGNAVKFRGAGPPRIHVAADRAGERGEWTVSVSDNGIGIDPKHSERVFAIFQRLHAPDRYPGSGIGLAICRKIVERHGGRIWVESRPGEGSTFRFTLAESAGGR